MSLYRHSTAYRLLCAPCRQSWREESYKDDDNNSDYEDIYSRDAPSSLASQFLIKDRYTRSEQYLALIREDPTVTMDTSTAGKSSIKFSKGSVTIRIIDFKVLDAPILFLLCLADMDRLKVYFNNTIDKLVQGNVRIPVIRK
ncbi:hypothetical protein BU23DRAFT_585051 [Bimuria novae-zelandiae CBS 107.79]|uniref:Uncharacterized protein n=1 Tax=Bimuria novae-zelandiae CBS 107.79 TaxID=1447943 RepID=A0A6A5UNF8_9PLEO|nr:hypothetical protein BU23DRAFT_585051 [Bimuria novae-zelandiae CBS 107.79]